VITFDLSDRVAVVTGSAQGIGTEYARSLGEAGAKVVVTDVIDVTPAVGQLQRQGIEALGIEADVTDEESLSRMANAVVEKWGKVDILINNAAIYGSMAKKPFWELDSSQWDQMLKVNVIGSFLAAKVCVSWMKEQKWGRIINIASGVIANAPPKMMHYNTSKAAVIGLTRSMARELGEFNINVNSLSPGLLDSEATKKVTSSEYLDQASLRRCLKRHEFPQDVVGTILYLCSPLADFVTGQNIIVDGGVVFS
jgi:NAD(P)-dependent dehydrogenase (short-subunit alcohol dehydrogenase family)